MTSSLYWRTFLGCLGCLDPVQAGSPICYSSIALSPVLEQLLFSYCTPATLNIPWMVHHCLIGLDCTPWRVLLLVTVYLISSPRSLLPCCRSVMAAVGMVGVIISRSWHVVLPIRYSTAIHTHTHTPNISNRDKLSQNKPAASFKVTWKSVK